MSADTPSGYTEPPRVLGPWAFALLTIGAVIGSGIFLVPGEVAAASGYRLAGANAVWLVGSVLSLCGALVYARLAALRPQAGGLYVYIRDGFGPVPASVFGWMTMIVNAAGSVATIAAAFAGIIAQVVPLPVPAGWVAALLAALLGCINLLPARSNGNFQGWTAALKLAAVLLFALLLITAFFARSHTVATAPPGAQPQWIVALIAVLWAFDGWQSVPAMSGEARDPQRTVALGLLVGVAALGTAYVLLSLGTALWLGPAELSGSPNVVKDALQHAGFPALATLLMIVLPISLVGAAHATLFCGSRVVYAMATDRMLPAVFAGVSPRTGVPTAAVLSCTGIAVVLSLLGSFQDLAAYVVVTSWLFYGLAGAALFRIPGALATGNRRLLVAAALLFCLGSAGVTLSGLISGPPAGRYGLLIVAVAWIAVLPWYRRRAQGELT
ncbi:MAG: APC family permease [Proteobacteria bacterium]|nr:APC family permease [Pseudomonadota bacterium]